MEIVMKTLNLREVKASLSKVIDEIERTGELVTVTRHGKPAVVLMPVAAADTLAGKDQPVDNRAFIEHLLSFPGPLEIDRKTGDFREVDF
jgi:prevent-host-death family protein